MYLPNKITGVFAKIDKSYEVKYTDGKITSIYLIEKEIKIEASSKGYCLNLKGGPIFLNDLKNLEPLLIKMNVIEIKNKQRKKESHIKDNLVELFSKKKNTFSVEYKDFKVLSIKMDNPSLSIKKTGVGYALTVNNESISVDNMSSLKKLLIKINLIEEEKTYNKKSNDNILFEQLTINLEKL